MKNHFCVLLLLAASLSFGQKTKPGHHPSAVITVEKFDKTRFEKFKPYKSSGTHKEYRIGNKNIRIITDTETIHVEESDWNSQYTTHKLYSAKSLLLKGKGQTFSNFCYGVDETYDSKGRIIRKFDCDAGYRFTLDQLIAKIKSLGIDITKKPELHFVNRYNEKGRPPAYSLLIRKSRDAMKVRLIEIDAVTGATISDRVTYMEE